MSILFFFSFQVTVVTAFFILVCSCLVAAHEKKINLDDIEQDNLKSEQANEDSKSGTEYSAQPASRAEQSAHYGAQQSEVQNTIQYAVEEPNASDQPELDYPVRATGANYVDLNRIQHQGQQIVYNRNHQSALQYAVSPPQQHPGLVQRTPMTLVLVPQIDTSSSNSVVLYANNQHQQQLYQQKLPAIAYQQVYHEQSPHAHQQTVESAKEGQQSEEHGAQTQFLPSQVQEEANSHEIQIQHPQYIAAPQYEQQQQYVSQQLPEYQQQQVEYAEPQGHAPVYQYTSQPQQYAVFSQLPQKQLYTQVNYKYLPPLENHNGRPQSAVGVGGGRPSHVIQPVATYSKPDETPKVLSQYAHGISRPIYSHISGNLVQNHYKSRYSPNSQLQQHFHVPQTGNGIEEDFRSIHSSYPYERKPSSLLDSYIPSSLQVAYLNKGYSKEPLKTYELIASQGYKYEKGFLPNQMYATPNGGVEFRNYKRHAKLS